MIGREAKGAEGVAVLAATAQGHGDGLPRLDWLAVLLAAGVLAWLGLAGSRRAVLGLPGTAGHGAYAAGPPPAAPGNRALRIDAPRAGAPRDPIGQDRRP